MIDKYVEYFLEYCGNSLKKDSLFCSKCGNKS